MNLKPLFYPYSDYSVSDSGKIFNKKGAELKGWLNKQGYNRVSLCKKGAKRDFYVHRLVALLFVSNKNTEELIEVHHKNEIRNDNEACNLEWVTHSQNMDHVYQKNKGWENNITQQPALTESQLLEIEEDVFETGIDF